MNTIKIPFHGITRNTDDGVCQDGDCMELINARVINGSIEPVSKPMELASYTDKFKSISFHSNVKKYIFISEDGSLSWKDEYFTSGGKLEGPGPTLSVCFVGNTMVAITNDGLRYFLHKDGSYYYLGEFPELPIVYTGCNSRTFTSERVVVKAPTGASVDEVKKLVYQQLYGLFLKLQNNANKEGYFVNGSIIRMAFRLFDGSHTRHSPLIFVPKDGELINQQVSLLGKSFTLDPLKNFFAFGVDGDLENPKTVEYTIQCAIISVKPTFGSVFVIPDSWKDIIIGLDIFSSFNIACPLPISDPLFQAANTDYIKPSFQNELQSAWQFFKIASYDTGGNLTYPVESVDKDSLALRESLSDDGGTNSINCPLSAYVYNSRIHIWDIKVKLLPWYDTLYLKVEDSGNPHSIDIYVHVSTNSGELVLHRRGLTYGDKISGIIMYPDYRATKITICIDSKRFKEFRLSRHQHLNAAVYFNLDSTGILRPIDTLSWDVGTPSVTVTSSTEEGQTAVLKVSELNNPFFFPPKNTYQFQTDIIAVQSNTVALSQGQFGQHPLYVFCKDGIYAMSVSTDGNVLYTTSTPVSRDVASSPYVAGIDSAVSFLSERGFMLIYGSQVQNISEVVDGFLPSCIISSPIIPKVMQVAGMQNLLSSVVFRDYCEGAKIGYNYQQSEIIIANENYPYAYSYNMKSASWYKIGIRIHFFINSYPNTYVFATKGSKYAIYDLNNNHRSVATMALLSRPIKMGTTTHKRILQTAIRGIVKRALSDLYLRGEPVMFREEGIDIFSDVGFYILGSNDAEHFSLIAGKESIVDIRDLVTKMNKSKAYKFFMVCLVGGVRSDVSINYIEAIADESYTNRLR